MNSNERLALVTGGAGFIGGHLVEGLLAADWSVRVIDDLSTGSEQNLAQAMDRIEFTRGDIRDGDVLKRVMEGVEVVFHQAAMASVPRSVAMPVLTNSINVDGTLLVLETARQSGVRRVVYAASSSAYGDTEVLPKVETLPATPLSPYALQKYTGEGYCRLYRELYGLETVALRYFNIFGPRQDPNSDYAAVVPCFVTAALEGRPPVIYGDGDQTRDFTYVENAVQANLLAADAEHASGYVINIAAGTRTSLNDLWQGIRKIVGTDLEAQHAAPREGDVRDSLADLTRASDLLGYAPGIDLDEGLDRTIASFRS
ncbi:MAG: SDR family oxidoreductase [Deltaproteobacteria bacterium]|nr:SDR family oxidoreductase [Deltaproteobacteria bacterium]